VGTDPFISGNHHSCFKKNPKAKKPKNRTSTLYFHRKLRHVPCPSQQLTNRLAVSQNPLRTPLCHRNIRQQAGLGSNLIDSSSAQSGLPGRNSLHDTSKNVAPLFTNELTVFQVWQRVSNDIVCTRKLGGIIHSYSRRAT